MLWDFCVEMGRRGLFPWVQLCFICMGMDSVNSDPKAECHIKAWHSCMLLYNFYLFVFLKWAYTNVLMVGCDLNYSVTSQQHMHTWRLVVQCCKKFLPRHVRKCPTTLPALMFRPCPILGQRPSSWFRDFYFHSIIMFAAAFLSTIVSVRLQTEGITKGARPRRRKQFPRSEV